MENYNEKINYGSETEPILRDRLYITTGIYGYNLFDRKTKENLLFCKSKVLCEEGLTLLRTSEFHFFESFKERIKYEEVIEPSKILIEHDKYGDSYYSIPTINDFYKVCLHLLKKRFENNYICKFDNPKELDYTYDDIEKMPESFRKDAKTKLDNYFKNVKECKEANYDYEMAEKALNEKNGRLAWKVIKNREDYEYEKIEIIIPNKI